MLSKDDIHIPMEFKRKVIQIKCTRLNIRTLLLPTLNTIIFIFSYYSRSTKKLIHFRLDSGSEDKPVLYEKK